MLVQVIIGIGMLSALAVQLPSLYESMNKSSKKAEVKLTVLAIQNQVTAYLETENIWEATFNHSQNNLAFDCIKNPANSCSSNSSFQIFNVNGDALTAAVASNPGYSNAGDTCTGFNSTNGNKDCPIGINLSFQKVCETPCLRPALKITVNYQYSGVRGIHLNSKNLSTKIFKPFSSSNILVHDEIYDITPGSLYIHPSGTRTTQKILQRTFFLDREAILMVAGSAGAILLPDPNPGLIRIRSKSNKLSLEINGQEVALSRTTSLSDNSTAISPIAVISHRNLTVGWTKKVGPGNVTVNLRYTAWVIWNAPNLSLPSMSYINLAYTAID